MITDLIPRQMISQGLVTCVMLHLMNQTVTPNEFRTRAVSRLTLPMRLCPEAVNMCHNRAAALCSLHYTVTAISF